MRITEISKLLRLPISGIYRRIKEGKFPNYKVDDNKYLIFNRNDVLKWKKENEKAKTAKN